MASLAALMQRVPDVHAELFAALRAAEAARGKELHAAVTIQKCIRGFLTRRRLDRLQNSVLCIQQTWRGHLGRLRAQLARETRDRNLRQEFFAAMATTIQRHWRGYWSRKSLFDFHARKQYLQRVAHVNSKMRELLREEADRTAHIQKAMAEQAAHAAFQEKIGKLHHLVSTAVQPGIFASPYQVAAGTIPMVAGAAVEDHLRAVKRATASPSLRSTAAAGAATASQAASSRSAAAFLPPIAQPRGSSPQAHPQLDAQHQQQFGTYASSVGRAGTMGPMGMGSTARSTAPGGAPAMRATSPVATVYMPGLRTAVPVHASLQQSVPYDVVHQAHMVDQKVSKAEILMHHPGPFIQSAHTPPAPALLIQSNRNLESYVTPWDPTLGARKDTFTPQQQAVSPARFGRYTGQGQLDSYIDKALHHPLIPTSMAPKVYTQLQRQGPVSGVVYAAGLTSADTRRMAKEAPRA